MSVLLLLLACGPAPTTPTGVAEHARVFGVQAAYHGPTHAGFRRASQYVPMRDGVRLAIDVILPDPLAAGERVPAVLAVTPYWRSREGDVPGPRSRFFATHGLAMVVADERGTGASFGLWRHPWTPESVADIGELVAWTAAQPWSNGRVGAIGDSYVGTTAQLAAAAGRPEVRAVIPRFMETDVYADVAHPGGIYLRWLIETWTDMVRGLSLGDYPGGATPGPRVRRVDGPDGPALLAQALEEHRQAPPFDMRGAVFRDDRAAALGVSWDDFSVHRRREAIERSGAAVYGWGSWLDGKTAEAVLRRFMTFQNPQRAVIGAWSHGGGLHVSPFARPDSAVLSREAQEIEHLLFFNRHLRDRAPGPVGRELVYFTLGAERWQRTDRWPPAGFRDERFHLAAGGRLARAVPPDGGDADRYHVDFTATTGSRSRWHTELDAGPVSYGDRSAADQKLLTYTSDPLEEDVEITGHPRARLWVRSTATDGAFHVYLEAVDEAGSVRHLTEGQLRGRDRKTSPAPYAAFGPYHGHTRADAAPLPLDRPVELDLALYPISACVPRGHRLRVAVAGADAGLFERVPPQGEVTITVERNRAHPSAVDLPVKRGLACRGTPPAADLGAEAP
jgi:putative CocE/NonD family hydrolase